MATHPQHVRAPERPSLLAEWQELAHDLALDVLELRAVVVRGLDLEAPREEASKGVKRAREEEAEGAEGEQAAKQARTEEGL